MVFTLYKTNKLPNVSGVTEFFKDIKKFHICCEMWKMCKDTINATFTLKYVKVVRVCLLLLSSPTKQGSCDVFIRNWQQVHERRNRFVIPWLVAILGAKFPKEQSLVHKTAIPCATQNRYNNYPYKRGV